MSEQLEINYGNRFLNQYNNGKQYEILQSIIGNGNEPNLNNFSDETIVYFLEEGFRVAEVTDKLVNLVLEETIQRGLVEDWVNSRET